MHLLTTAINIYIIIIIFLIPNSDIVLIQNNMHYSLVFIERSSVVVN